MRILKIKGKDERTIKEQIQKEYGEGTIIISSHQERVEGVFGFFKKPQYVVTIAVEDQEVDIEQPKEQPFNQTLTDLKNEVERLKKELQPQKDSRSEIFLERPIFNEEKQTMVDLLEDRLEREGLHSEVIKELFTHIEKDMTIDEMVRVLYTKIKDIFLPSGQNEMTKHVFFIGPTGVGKTTTIAKLTAEKVLNQHQKVTLLTADTYRIAAIEQLRTYAEILDVPIEIIYEEKDLQLNLDKWCNADCIFIDTAGRSHKNVEQMIHMESLLSHVQGKKIYLVLNMNTQIRDLKKIIENYQLLVEDFEIILTKSDETDVIGNVLNVAFYAQKPIAYMTTGQSVPDDIHVFDPHEYARELLGRVTYE